MADWPARKTGRFSNAHPDAAECRPRPLTQTENPNVAGIRSTSGTITRIIDSTISGNTANSIGDGIQSRIGQLTVINSTISRNTANKSGGGIQKSNASTVSLANATLANNRADAAADGTGSGGGNVNGADQWNCKSKRCHETKYVIRRVHVRD